MEIDNIGFDTKTKSVFLISAEDTKFVCQDGTWSKKQKHFS